MSRHGETPRGYTLPLCRVCEEVGDALEEAERGLERKCGKRALGDNEWRIHGMSVSECQGVQQERVRRINP